MVLNDDLKGFASLWKEPSPLGKVFFGGTLLVSALSVGSLADAVFEFKGFVVEAIRLYREATDPLIAFFAEYISLDFRRPELDVLAVWLLLVGCFYRSSMLLIRKLGAFSFGAGLGRCFAKVGLVLWGIGMMLIITLVLFFMRPFVTERVTRGPNWSVCHIAVSDGSPLYREYLQP